MLSQKIYMPFLRCVAYVLNLISKNGFLGFIRLILGFFLTKIVLPQATLIRYPFYIRNIGNIFGARGLISGPNLILDVLSTDATLTIGCNLRVNHSVHIAAMHQVVIGNNVLMASGVYISDHSHGIYQGNNQTSPNTPPNSRSIHSKPVFIGDNCWLGEHVCVLPGVTIGHGTVVGAGSVVTKNIPSNCIAVGVPAEVIKKWDVESSCWRRI